MTSPASSTTPSGAQLSAIVLAAGQGTRMKSALPKPAHRLAGRSMVGWVLHALKACDTTQIVVVVGHGSDVVISRVNAEHVDVPVHFAEQRHQRGTGDAASVGLAGLPDHLVEDADVLVLPGDTPLLTGETLAAMVHQHRAADSVCTMMTTRVADPTGYGRVLRGRDGGVERIVEHRDASPEELAVDEINCGIYCFRQSSLSPALRKIRPNNAQGEFYLTDVVQVLREAGYPVHAYTVPDPVETSGVNDRSQLIEAELELRRRINTEWMQQGISILDPAGTPVDVGASIGSDTTIHPGTSVLGTTVIGEGVTLGPNTIVADSSVGDASVVVQSNVAGSVIEANAHIGPFTVIEPGAHVAAGATVEPFTIVKATDIT